MRNTHRRLFRARFDEKMLFPVRRFGWDAACTVRSSLEPFPELRDVTGPGEYASNPNDSDGRLFEAKSKALRLRKGMVHHG
jgi:hypothetical protein